MKGKTFMAPRNIRALAGRTRGGGRGRITKRNGLPLEGFISERKSVPGVCTECGGLERVKGRVEGGGEPVFGRPKVTRVGGCVGRPVKSEEELRKEKTRRRGEQEMGYSARPCTDLTSKMLWEEGAGHRSRTSPI